MPFAVVYRSGWVPNKAPGGSNLLPASCLEHPAPNPADNKPVRMRRRGLPGGEGYRNGGGDESILPGQRQFRGADEQDPVRRKQTLDALKRFLLGGPIEINQQVAAKHEVVSAFVSQKVVGENIP